MADDKQGRDKQAHDERKRQQKRDAAEALERRDETRPVQPTELSAVEEELADVEFPATGADVVATLGDHVVESTEGTFTVAELVPETDDETFDAPDAVRVRIEKPTIAAAMKRVLEASHTLPNATLGRSQRDAYVKTFEELKAIDADDDDEGIQAISDWIVDRISEKERLPGSRDVRRQAAKFCRSNGYQVRNDEWLGI